MRTTAEGQRRLTDGFQHLVALVEHKSLDRAAAERLLADEAVDPPGRADEDVRAAVLGLEEVAIRLSKSEGSETRAQSRKLSSAAGERDAETTRSAQRSTSQAADSVPNRRCRPESSGSTTRRAAPSTRQRR